MGKQTLEESKYENILKNDFFQNNNNIQVIYYELNYTCIQIYKFRIGRIETNIEYTSIVIKYVIYNIISAIIQLFICIF